ncbi:hypothetical protein HW274_00710 [Actinomyces sp. oral taxon 169]|uniref:hypothetical protein n=1 Tax=Actinomyces sp. oral taxon 169 TaxID=712116 RepID=UPI0015FE8FFD|nr:hypothetical protein [Actinomyces sp. oral taxon 169]QLF52428.1 hypothetical protein HW274_00710 [Actinomyces sp. oral taxon 169]
MQIARLHSSRATCAPDADDVSLPGRAARAPDRAAEAPYRAPETPGCASPHWLSRPVRLRPFTSICHSPAPSSPL